jgi:hypothetical protein
MTAALMAITVQAAKTQLALKIDEQQYYRQFEPCVRTKTDRINWHHIVARSDSRAVLSRQVLTNNGISVDDPDNLMPLSGEFHSHLHTTKYHEYVYNVIKTASNPASVRNKLNILRLEISAYSYSGICPWL